jgi:hypothetical protein
VADGGASSIAAIADIGGVPLAETQKDLTPLQRMVLIKESERQAEESQNGRGSGRAGGGGHVQNSLAGGPSGGGGGISGETVTYVNEGVNDGE